MDSRPGAVRQPGAPAARPGGDSNPAVSMLQELRFWQLVTACLWHAASCVAVVRAAVPFSKLSPSQTCSPHSRLRPPQVTVLHTFVGVPGGYLWVRDASLAASV